MDVCVCVEINLRYSGHPVNPWPPSPSTSLVFAAPDSFPLHRFCTPITRRRQRVMKNEPSALQRRKKLSALRVRHIFFPPFYPYASVPPTDRLPSCLPASGSREIAQKEGGQKKKEKRHGADHFANGLQLSFVLAKERRRPTRNDSRVPTTSWA